MKNMKNILKENLTNEFPAAIYTLFIFGAINVAVAIAWYHIVSFCSEHNVSLMVMFLAIINIFAVLPVGIVAFVTQFLFFPAFSIARKCREKKRVFICAPLNNDMNALAYALGPIAIAEVAYTTSVVITILMFLTSTR